MIRSRSVKAMPEETTMDDLDAIKGSPWAPSGVLRDVLPDVPRPILSPDEPPFVPAEERPVPSNMKISKKFGYTPGCAKCRKIFRNDYYSHTVRQQAGQTLCIVLSVQKNERWTSTQRKWNELIIQDESHWNRGEIPSPSADETVDPSRDRSLLCHPARLRQVRLQFRSLLQSRQAVV